LPQYCHESSAIDHPCACSRVVFVLSLSAIDQPRACPNIVMSLRRLTTHVLAQTLSWCIRPLTTQTVGCPRHVVGHAFPRARLCCMRALVRRRYSNQAAHVRTNQHRSVRRGLTARVACMQTRIRAACMRACMHAGVISEWNNKPRWLASTCAWCES